MFWKRWMRIKQVILYGLTCKHIAWILLTNDINLKIRKNWITAGSDHAISACGTQLDSLAITTCTQISYSTLSSYTADPTGLQFTLSQPLKFNYPQRICTAVYGVGYSVHQQPHTNTYIHEQPQALVELASLNSTRKKWLFNANLLTTEPIDQVVPRHTWTDCLGLKTMLWLCHAQGRFTLPTEFLYAQHISV